MLSWTTVQYVLNFVSASVNNTQHSLSEHLQNLITKKCCSNYLLSLVLNLVDDELLLQLQTFFWSIQLIFKPSADKLTFFPAFIHWSGVTHSSHISHSIVMKPSFLMSQHPLLISSFFCSYCLWSEVDCDARGIWRQKKLVHTGIFTKLHYFSIKLLLMPISNNNYWLF